MHKGKYYPRHERVDFRFPDPPWEVPPKLFVWDGFSWSGGPAIGKPVPPLVLGLTWVLVTGKRIEYLTQVTVGLDVWSCRLWYDVEASAANWATLSWRITTALGKSIIQDNPQDVLGYTEPNELLGPWTTTGPGTLDIVTPGYVFPKPW